MAAVPDGSIFVADTGNHRIQHFSSDGAFIGAWGREGRHPGGFREIRALAVDSQGSVYVADRSNYRVQVLGPDGALHGRFRGGLRGGGQARHHRAAGVGRGYAVRGGHLQPRGAAHRPEGATEQVIELLFRGEVLLFVLLVAALIASLSVHEFGHALVAKLTATLPRSLPAG